MKNIAEELSNLIFFLNSRSFTRASKLISKTLELIKSIPIIEKPSEDILKNINLLEQKLQLLKRCASSSFPRDQNACLNEAKQVYRQTLLLYLLATSRIKELSKARRYAYSSIALGLPTSALFGLSPLAIGLIFLGVLWTYIYFIRLKLAGWIVLVSSLMLLLPFLVNAVYYFSSTLFNTSELNNIAEALGTSLSIALIVVIVLLIVSVVALSLNIYSLHKLIIFRDIFE
ncbi:MAG: hypothetical protein QXV54_04610 [Desulfurococcaceae archaeon]